MSKTMTTRDFTNTYSDTRGNTQHPLTFTQAIIKGIAPGGGLYVPQVLPRLSLDELIGLGQLDYAPLAAAIYQLFGVDLPTNVIDTLMAQAYADNFDTPQVAPVTQVAPNTHVLELWHGPTSAFKDMALQCLPLFFSAAIDASGSGSATADTPGPAPAGTAAAGTAAATAAAAASAAAAAAAPAAATASPTPTPTTSGNPSAAPTYLILVATSGDTGKAALEGFKNRPHTRIIVFYPSEGVSDIQYRQMVTQQGNNVTVIGVQGNFDDCQTAVKATFNDPQFNQKLAQEHNIQLSSANSINWGRLLPQVIYYVSAYTQLVASGALAPGQPLDICVPTGNFGNILAAYYAGQIGLPLGRLLCASNENRVLTDFINTGVYDITNRPFHLTPSPSMDILVSSNLERQLYELNGRNPQLINQWMDSLSTTRRFQVDKDTFAALRANFSADWVSSDECLMTIKDVFHQHNYLLDPHTAVAWKVAQRLHSENPVLVVATAHWAKFGSDVYRALNNLPAGSPLPPEITPLTDTALNTLIATKIAQEQGDGSSITSPTGQGDGSSVSSVTIPPALAELDTLPIRFTQTCQNTPQAIQQSVLDTL